MNLKNLFTASALVAIMLGLGLILVPVPLMTARTGQPPDILTTHVARQFGTVMLTSGVISWMARNAADSAARNAIVVGLTLLYVLLPIETAISVARGAESVEGLVLVIIFGLLAFGFLLIGKPRFTPRGSNQ
jgi:hypothetical protein